MVFSMTFKKTSYTFFLNQYISTFSKYEMHRVFTGYTGKEPARDASVPYLSVWVPILAVILILVSW